MLAVPVEELRARIDGRLVAGPEGRIIGGVSIDTRTITPNDIFFCLQGENFDGHSFAAEALERKALGVVVGIGRGDEAAGKARRGQVVLEAPDTLQALHALAFAVRDRLKAEVVGITGSTGKTSTKDMIRSIIGQRLAVVASPKNFNNEIGVPLTIFEATQDTRVLVVEMGMRGFGQIEELARLTRPTVSVVTNVGLTHYELIGSEEGIAKAKAELVSVTPAGGTVILNADDGWTSYLASHANGAVATFGLSRNAQVRASNINVDATGRPTFDLFVGGDRLRVRLPVLGRYNVHNALAAATAAFTLGFSMIEVRDGLEHCTICEMRMEVCEAGAVTVLNDTYNANPASMRAALSVLDDMQAARKIAVLGDMLELGAVSDQAHRSIGEEVARVAPDLLVAVGKRARGIALGAKAEGLNGARVEMVSDNTSAARLLANRVTPGDVVLVKASRAMKLEEVVRSLCGTPQPGKR